jgi:hypothetical protein
MDAMFGEEADEVTRSRAWAWVAMIEDVMLEVVVIKVAVKLADVKAVAQNFV